VEEGKGVQSWVLKIMVRSTSFRHAVNKLQLVDNRMSDWGSATLGTEASSIDARHRLRRLRKTYHRRAKRFNSSRGRAYDQRKAERIEFHVS